jgi:shikimate kinase
MAFQSLPQFYQSDEWRSFRAAEIAARIGADGILRCAHCGKPILQSYDAIAHHKIPLTMQNVNDYSISLNPENIAIVHAKCHNEIHNRFGYCTQRKVYLVYGSPCSGKTTFVDSIKGNSDIVVDMDLIWQCITGGREKYFKPNALKTNAFIVRDCLLDMVKTRAGKWENAYVLTGGALKGDRERLAASLGAEYIFIDTPREICLERLASDPQRTDEQKREWIVYIDKWWEEYQPA